MGHCGSASKDQDVGSGCVCIPPSSVGSHLLQWAPKALVVASNRPGPPGCMPAPAAVHMQEGLACSCVKLVGDWPQAQAAPWQHTAEEHQYAVHSPFAWQDPVFQRCSAPVHLDVPSTPSPALIPAEHFPAQGRIQGAHLRGPDGRVLHMAALGELCWQVGGRWG